MRDILVVSLSTRDFGSEADVASRLAAHLHARLTGIFLIEPILVPPTYDSTVVALLEAEVGVLREQAAGASQDFERFAHQRGCLSAHWYAMTGALVPSTARAACWNDMVVVRRDDDCQYGGVAAIGDLLLGVGTPMLIVPAACNADVPFARVTIGFSGSIESVRALRASVPLIAGAKEVVLLHAEPAPFPDAVPFGAAAFLARHGIAVDERSVSAGLSGEKFMEAVESTEPDLLVMGAYGRSRFSEWLLGGATRIAVSRCPVPLFLAH